MVTSGTSVCEYTTYDSCLRKAEEHQSCLRNPLEPIPIIGEAPFCVVSELQAECIHREGHSCHKAALMTTGVCAKNPNYRE